ncbi:MAG: DUF2069 domain-containing protein [Lautropia sp.]|nr:DUF2069 domain-containing protein [Lautropia sp.]
MNPQSPPAPSPVDIERLHRQQARWRRLVLGACWALVLLGTAWELWLAPLRPGGSLLVLKVVPLVLAIRSMARNRIRTYQLWSMLILIYLCEGIVRGMSDPQPAATLGWIEALLAAVGYLAVLGYVRATRQLVQAAPRPPAHA